MWSGSCCGCGEIKFQTRETNPAEKRSYKIEAFYAADRYHEQEGYLCSAVIVSPGGCWRCCWRCCSSGPPPPARPGPPRRPAVTPDPPETPDAPQASDPPDGLPAVEPLAHKQLLHLEDAAEPVTASVAPYETAADLSNIVNLDQFYLSDGAAAPAGGEPVRGDRPAGQ